MESTHNQKKYKILFVCLGNICRSPAGEGILKKYITDRGLQNQIEIDSAGTSGYHDGELPDRRMRHHGQARGYVFDSLSRKFTVNDFDDFDLVLAMDDSNYDNIMSFSMDTASQSKVHRMIDFSKKYHHDHIPDPYYSGADGFELVLDLLEDACDGLVSYLEENKIIK